MSEKHRMSITSKGSLTDIVETIFRGNGSQINIGGRNYTLREYGNLSEQDPVRVSMLRELENHAKINLKSRYSIEIELGNDKKEQQPTLKINYFRAEEIPSAEEDKKAHNYMIVKGTRYRIEIEGNPKTIGISANQIEQQGRQMMLAHQKRHGKLPDRVEVGLTLKKEVGIGPFKFKKKY